MRGTCFVAKPCPGLQAKPQCLSGGAVAGLSSISWTLCSLQGVVEALSAVHTQPRHAVLSTSLLAMLLLPFTQDLPLILGDELRRMSEPSSGPLSHSLHVLCDLSLEETLPACSLFFCINFFLIEKYTYCKVHAEVGTHVSTIQVKKQDLVTLLSF